MNERITIKYAGREYSAHLADFGVSVGVAFITPVHRRRHVVMPDEESARRWLSDNGLRKSKAKKLLAAALRDEGDYADPAHPHRCRCEPHLPLQKPDYAPIILNRL
jgi:hypothetical protein